jgi:hypothetical protein
MICFIIEQAGLVVTLHLHLEGARNIINPNLETEVIGAGHYFSSGIPHLESVCCSILVEMLFYMCYKPEGRGFESR